jgi:predicted nucleic acid-binding protein
MQTNIKKLIAVLSKYPNFKIYPFDEVVLNEYFKTSPELEIHDRLIVATAKLTNSKVITKDKQITNSRLVKTVW